MERAKPLAFTIAITKKLAWKMGALFLFVGK
jgi:hypothetical protein